MMKTQIQHPEILAGLVGDRDDERSNTTHRATSRPVGDRDDEGSNTTPRATSRPGVRQG